MTRGLGCAARDPAASREQPNGPSLAGRTAEADFSDSREPPFDSSFSRRYGSLHGRGPTRRRDQARFPFDPIYKALRCHRQTVEDMLRSYLAEPGGPLDRTLIDALDFGR